MRKTVANRLMVRTSAPNSAPIDGMATLIELLMNGVRKEDKEVTSSACIGVVLLCWLFISCPSSEISQVQVEPVYDHVELDFIPREVDWRVDGLNISS